MKKISSVLIMATMFTVGTTTAKAQLLAANFTGSTTGFLSANSASGSVETAKSAKAAAKIHKANFKATADFAKHFKGAPDANWAVENEAITASYNENDTKTTVVYSTKGHWLYTMNIYQADKMPKTEKEIVTDAYPRYQITQVQDIKEGNMHFYVVHLEDSSSFKEIVLNDGQLGVLKEFNKQ